MSGFELTIQNYVVAQNSRDLTRESKCKIFAKTVNVSLTDTTSLSALFVWF